MIQGNLECPSCGRIDFVQKVSSIVSAGTSSSTYRGHADGLGYTPNGPVGINEYITVSSNSQTALSGLLSPPPQPRYVSPWSDALGVLTIILWLAFGLSMLFFIGSFSFSDLTYLFVWASILAFLGIILFFIHRQMSRESQSIRKQVEVGTPRWQTAISVWQCLYYCHRCDGIYIPIEDSLLVPTAQMMDYLYIFSQ